MGCWRYKQHLNPLSQHWPHYCGFFLMLFKHTYVLDFIFGFSLAMSINTVGFLYSTLLQNFISLNFLDSKSAKCCIYSIVPFINRSNLPFPWPIWISFYILIFLVRVSDVMSNRREACGHIGFYICLSTFLFYINDSCNMNNPQGKLWNHSFQENAGQNKLRTNDRIFEIVSVQPLMLQQA